MARCTVAASRWEMVMAWEVSVFSSMVSSVGYNDETSELIVTWAKSGRRSIYSGVDEETALSLSKAASVGQMINTEIKPNYAHRYG
jgi:KTSC domain